MEKIKSWGKGFIPGVKQKLPRKYSGKIKQVIPPSDRVLYFGERSIISPPNDWYYWLILLEISYKFC